MPATQSQYALTLVLVCGCFETMPPDGILKCSRNRARQCPPGFACAPDRTGWRIGHHSVKVFHVDMSTRQPPEVAAPNADMTRIDIPDIGNFADIGSSTNSLAGDLAASSRDLTASPPDLTPRPPCNSGEMRTSSCQYCGTHVEKCIAGLGMLSPGANGESSLNDRRNRYFPGGLKCRRPGNARLGLRFRLPPGLA
jgi:hypothetical protein